MKAKIVLCCLLTMLFWFSYSCGVSFLTPNSPISNEHFSIISPDEEGWSKTTKYETGNDESICLEKGSPGVSFTRSPEYPIQEYLVMRKRVRIETTDEKMLLDKLNEVIRDEILKRLNKYGTYYHFISDNKEEENYYRFSCDNGCGIGLGEYYIYLPNYYSKYLCCYFFQYTIDMIATSGKEDKFTPQYISKGLLNFIKNFKCVEDSIDSDNNFMSK